MFLESNGELWESYVLFLLATSVFLTRASFIVIFFSITIKYQNSIFIKYIKKFEISLGRLIVGGTCLFSKARTILETVPILSSSHERRARLLGRCSMNETRVLGQFLSGRYRSVLRIENKLGYYEKHEEFAK